MSAIDNFPGKDRSNADDENVFHEDEHQELEGFAPDDDDIVQDDELVYEEGDLPEGEHENDDDLMLAIDDDDLEPPAAPVKKKPDYVFYGVATAVALGVSGVIAYNLLWSGAQPSQQHAQMPMATQQEPQLATQGPQSDIFYQGEGQGAAPIPLEQPSPIAMQSEPMPAQPEPALPAPEVGYTPEPVAPAPMPSPRMTSAPAEGAPALTQAPSDNNAELHARIGELEESLSAQNVRMEALNETLTSVAEDLAKLAGRMDDGMGEVRSIATEARRTAANAAQQARAAREATPAPRQASTPRQAAPRAAQAAPVTQYEIYAMRSDRVWLRHLPTGNSIDVTAGEMVAGVGKIEAIILQDQKVVFEGGRSLSVN